MAITSINDVRRPPSLEEFIQFEIAKWRCGGYGSAGVTCTEVEVREHAAGLHRARFPKTTAASRARRGDYVVELAGRAEIAPFIAAHHYARGCSNTCTHSFALRAARSGVLVGGAMWLPPTRRCAESVDRASWQRVTSLSRLVLLDDEPHNAESLFVGAMLRHLERERRWVAAVTFADTSQGHRGTIYRATNWEDCGLTKLEPRWEDASGRQVSRLSTKSRTDDVMRELGYRMVGRFAKHKFVYRFTGTRSARA